MNAIKIALCQMNVVDNKSQNIQKAIEMIENAKKQGADLAVLPEMFNCPYENEKFIEYGESSRNSETLNEISKTAKKLKIHVLAGSIPEREIKDDGESLYNTSVFFDNEGKILGKHRKMHLFDIDVKGEIYFKESDTLEPGNDFTIIKTELATIGIGICYDVRFVELSRIMALEGAWITQQQIEAARVAMTRYMKRGGKVWINIFPHLSLTRIPLETRMGKGKGQPEAWVAVVKQGKVMFEVGGVSEEVAREALRLAMHKLPIKCKFVKKESGEASEK